MKRIAVLGSGGDCQGMNSVIVDLVRRARTEGIEVIGIKKGYKGLFEKNYVVLTPEMFIENDVENRGGCFLKASRCLELQTPEGEKTACAFLDELKIDVLVVIGGNGSFMGAQRFIRHGKKVMCLPGTIDNDLSYVSKTLGFDTAVANSVEAVNKIKQTMLTNDRGVVIEVMGRHNGSIALNVAVSTAACSLIVNEDGGYNEKLVEDEVKRAINRGIESPVVILSENIVNIDDVVKNLEAKTGKQFRGDVLSYIQRGGDPTFNDRIYATRLACRTIELIKEGTFNRAIGLKDGKIIDVPVADANTNPTNFDFELLKIFKEMNQ